MGRLSRGAAGIVALVAALRLPAPEQEMAVPVDLQFSLFYRILTYDRTLERRAADGLVIGVVFQRRFRESALARDLAIRQLPPDAAGFRVRFVSIDLDDVDLASAAVEGGCDVLYVTPLRAVSLRTVTSVSRARGLLTLTGVAAYVEQGLAVGIGLRGDRPEILVNVAASRAEGADFSAQLLGLARTW